ncbi:MAG: fumarate hydratase [Candidatus Schekmanbacteria bacterium RBG_13_48_7]|uniref:Fumarate hydratase n=1 Tax=Candidatus Schekmanbacteria bacterium RBG_13_48_7 TaxID=1817878 RepID=A0A1F7S008_9BACT|nr:MAG: fumarate hydratase [Candidatus Schekmanbacteria bacterium RBG_13_48_7]
MELVDAIFSLVKKCSTDLPPDVEDALRKAKDLEDPGSPAESALKTMLENVELSRTQTIPICQDTGTPVFYVYYPTGTSTLPVTDAIHKGVQKATKESILRPNAVDPVTGTNSGNNCGIGFPSITFVEENRDDLKISLMLKGGGSENCGAQYRLPDAALKAGRDLNGVKNCVYHAIHAAQGKGCAPGIVGIGIGGDRGSSYLASKKVLFRKFEDNNDDPVLANLEKEIYKNLNELGIGPMGFGGKTTVLGVKAAKMHRVPASFFVSITYMCWACRRYSMIYRKGGIEIG